MSEKGQSRKSMFSGVKNVEELRRLYDSDTPVLAYAFRRRAVEGWTPEHSHLRGQLVALTQGMLIVEAGSERWMFPSGRCAWTPPNCKHAARSVGGAAGAMVDLSPEICRGLPKTPCMFNSSELLFAIVHRMVGWDLRQPLNPAKKHLITTLRDEIRQPDQQPLHLTYQEKKDWPELQKLSWMMLRMTARWTLGRMLPEWPAVLSCVRFRLRQACHLAVGDSKRAYLLPLRCWHKGNLSRRSLSQSVTTV